MTEQKVDAEPQDVEIEQFTLGALIVRNELIDVVADELRSDHFFDPLHARIFDTMLSLRVDGEVTPEILASVMKRDPAWEELKITPREYLRTLALAAPHNSAVKEYSKLIIEYSLRRDLLHIGDEIARRAIKEQRASRIAEDATEQLLMLGRDTVAKPIPAYDIAMQSLKDVEAIQKGESAPIVQTGLRKLDDELGGLRGDDLIVVSAKSGMGKSALMGCIALNTARNGVPTLVISIEMARKQWIERMVCDLDFGTHPKPLFYSKIRNGRVSAEEFTRFAEAAKDLHNLPFEIRDDGDLTIAQITSIARAFKAKHQHKMGIVFIDYLQIVNPGDSRERSREQQVNSIARGAKALAKLLHWPVVVGSQMNEDATNRAKEERRPQAEDVRESKGIMNEADLMLSPWREAFFIERRKPLGEAPSSPAWENWNVEWKAKKNRFDLLTLKNRHGHRPDIELYAEMGASAIRDEAPVSTAMLNYREDVRGLL